MGGNVGKLVGTPWHTEILKEKTKDARRHRGRCIYYDKLEKVCKAHHRECMGSARCSYYMERQDSSNNNSKHVSDFAGLSSEDTRILKNKISDDEGIKLFPIGSIVDHKYYGIGKTLKISEGKILVGFEKGERWFDLYMVKKEQILYRIQESNKDTLLPSDCKIRKRVVGAYKGEFTIVSYRGKIKHTTQRKLQELCFKLEYENEKNKVVLVYVDLSRRIIYVQNDQYKKYENILKRKDYIELKSKR